MDFVAGTESSDNDSIEHYKNESHHDIPETPSRKNSENVLQDENEKIELQVHLDALKLNIEQRMSRQKSLIASVDYGSHQIDDELNRRSTGFALASLKSSRRNTALIVTAATQRLSKPKRHLGFNIPQTEIEDTIVNPASVPTHIVQKLRKIISQDTRHAFITGSTYNGAWYDALKTMNGYGMYTFPDGSKYRGYFNRGKFHGYGTLHLAAPHNFTYKGTFLNGVLDEIEDMWFDDGLHVKASFANWAADLSEWKYCCTKDRRFAAEQTEGLPPVGPYSFLTPNRPTRTLKTNYYDVEDGLYNPSSGLVLDRAPPLPSMSVPCKEEAQWIIKNCRHGDNVEEEIPAATYRKVIENNLQSEVRIKDHEPGCNFNQRLYHKRYFRNLCKQDVKDHLEAKISDESIGYRSPNSSSPCESFAISSISMDVQDHLETERAYASMKLGRDLEQEAHTLISDPVKVALRRASSIFSV